MRKKNTIQGQKVTANPVQVVADLSSVASKPEDNKVVLIEMVNEEGKKASVHPLEVYNYAMGGFKAV
tara:strand:+ start:6249 stop:6449 length:201 start_codon:yes stop_codon:yes gene_type:complete